MRLASALKESAPVGCMIRRPAIDRQFPFKWLAVTHKNRVTMDRTIWVVAGQVRCLYVSCAGAPDVGPHLHAGRGGATGCGLAATFLHAQPGQAQALAS